MADWQQDLLERFLRYVQTDTTADPQSADKPSSAGQFELLKILRGELEGMDGFSTELLPSGYLLARKAGSAGPRGPLALLAHVDTSPDAPGRGVKPKVHRNYAGQIIELEGGLKLDPAEDDYLAACVGDTVISSDGTTLLGADDKAGVAILMSYAQWLSQNPAALHPDLEFVFTTDEEIGRGVENFPFDKLKARRGLTVDGGRLGELEDECYHAYHVQALLEGKSHHPGDARGKLVNAVSMAATLVSLLPRSESPEATDGRYGCLWANSIQGSIEEARLSIYIRDFSEDECQRRLELVRQAAKTVECVFPGGKISLDVKKQYSNMRDFLRQDPEFLEKLTLALKRAGVEPLRTPIRGGTDGARLSEQGLLCPNLFAGGTNFHSRREWVPLGAMVKAVQVLQELSVLWTGEGS